MKRKRHTTEQIIRKLREAEQMRAAGKSVGEVCQTLEISDQTYHRWKAKYRGMDCGKLRSAPFSADQRNQRIGSHMTWYEEWGQITPSRVHAPTP